jgi:hypothetical protein
MSNNKNNNNSILIYNSSSLRMPMPILKLKRNNYNTNYVTKSTQTTPESNQQTTGFTTQILS